MRGVGKTTSHGSGASGVAGTPAGRLASNNTSPAGDGQQAQQTPKKPATTSPQSLVPNRKAGEGDTSASSRLTKPTYSSRMKQTAMPARSVFQTPASKPKANAPSVDRKDAWTQPHAAQGPATPARSQEPVVQRYLVRDPSTQEIPNTLPAFDRKSSGEPLPARPDTPDSPRANSPVGDPELEREAKHRPDPPREHKSTVSAQETSGPSIQPASSSSAKPHPAALDVARQRVLDRQEQFAALFPAHMDAARVLFIEAAGKAELALGDLERLHEFYTAKLGPRLAADEHRKLETLSFYVEDAIGPAELESMVSEIESFQGGRVWGQGLTVFSAGFFMMGLYAFLSARYGWKMSADPERDQIANYFVQSLIVGFGGTFGSSVIARGKLEPNYIETKAVKDGKVVPAMAVAAGKLIEYSSFWPFAIGHPTVEHFFKDNPADKDGKAAAKWISACVSSVGVCLHKQYMPRLMMRDPMVLDASTPQKKEAIRAMRREMQRNTPLKDYAQAWGTGLTNTVGIPSTKMLTRAIIHSISAAIVLALMLSAGIHKDDAFALAVAGSIFVGFYWGAGSRMSRAVVSELEEQAVAQARPGIEEAARAAFMDDIEQGHVPNVQRIEQVVPATLPRGNSLPSLPVD